MFGVFKPPSLWHFVTTVRVDSENCERHKALESNKLTILLAGVQQELGNRGIHFKLHDALLLPEIMQTLP